MTGFFILSKINHLFLLVEAVATTALSLAFIRLAEYLCSKDSLTLPFQI